MQEVDAQRRLAILRGETPPPLPEKDDAEDARIDGSSADPSAARHGSARRKRKRAGEDDTDFELRLARERDEPAVNSLERTPKTTSSAPITDHAGHIDLFGDTKSRAHAEKNEEAEKESRKKKRAYEDQYTMRFSNAPGKDGTNRPWYSQSDPAAVDTVSKDVWGNEDPKRKERDMARRNTNDPLAMMKQAASKVRELKQERKKFQDERDAELKQMRKEDRRREKRDRRDEGAKRHSESRESDRRRRRSRERRHEDDGERHKHRRRHEDDERRRRRDSRSPDHRRHRHTHD